MIRDQVVIGQHQRDCKGSQGIEPADDLGMQNLSQLTVDDT